MTEESNDEREMVVLRDQAGHYYALPRELFAVMRVPDDKIAAVEAAISADDTEGFVVGPCDRPRQAPLSLNVVGVARLAPGTLSSFGLWQPRGAVGPCF